MASSDELQIATILSTDESHFRTIISHLMSPVNEQRSQAEHVFNLCKQRHPDALVLKLSQLLSSSSFPEARDMSAVLLRGILLDDELQPETFFHSLDSETQLILKYSLLDSVVKELSRSVANKICDTISQLASLVLVENGWPELLPLLFQCVNSKISRHRESAMLIFAELAQNIGETLLPHLVNLHDVFSVCLGTGTDPDVRIAALNALINFIQCLEEDSDRDKFRDLLPLMMCTLTEAVHTKDESTAQDALKLLIELAGAQPGFLRNQITKFVESILSVAEDETLEDRTKHLALEFVITLVEARERAPGMVSSAEFVKRLFETLMKMLLDVEDDQVADENSDYTTVLEYLDRLLNCLGGDVIVLIACNILPTYLAAPERQRRHVAQDVLKVLIQLAGTITEVVESMLQIAEDETLEEGSKHVALEFLINLVEVREREPRMISNAEFVERLFEILMKMLLDVEDEFADENSKYTAGLEYLDRLLISFDVIAPVACEILQAYLASPERQRRHAAQDVLKLLIGLAGADNSHFRSLMIHLMSPINERRSQAETLFNLCKQQHPDAIILKLSQLHSSTYLSSAELKGSYVIPSERVMYAVLLRCILTPSKSQSQPLYPSLSPETQGKLKSTLLECVAIEPSRWVAKKLCDTVSELASFVLPENGWPELLPFMFQNVYSENPRHRESALLIFAELAQNIGETLVPHLLDLRDVFSVCLGTRIDPDVRIVAFNALINFIRCLEKDSDRDKFHDLLPLMMHTLTEAVKTNDESTTQKALKLLIELAGAQPGFLRNQLTQVVESILQIAEDETLEEVTKHLALEFVITLAEALESQPGMVNTLGQFIERLLDILIMMLSDVEDDPALHSAKLEHEHPGGNSNYTVGIEYLDRLSISLYQHVVRATFDILPFLLQSSEWQRRHAALIAISQVVEGSLQAMTEDFGTLALVVLISFVDPHPWLRRAAINLTCLLFSAVGPHNYKHNNNKVRHVVRAFASAMDDSNNPLLQARAVSVEQKLSENPKRLLNHEAYDWARWPNEELLNLKAYDWGRWPSDEDFIISSHTIKLLFGLIF